jgi:hypothetical protein
MRENDDSFTKSAIETFEVCDKIEEYIRNQLQEDIVSD